MVKDVGLQPHLVLKAKISAGKVLKLFFQHIE